MQNQTIYQLAGSGVQKLIPYQPGKPVTELQRELGLEKIIKLASNENPLGPGPQTVAAIHAALPELARYPDGAGFELKCALSAKHNLSTEQITLGNGSNEILELLARTFLTPECEVIFSQHSFAVYPLVTQAVGAKGKSVPALNYGHNLDAMLAAVTANTRMVFIANPNNPTGTYIQHNEVEAFIKALPEQVLCVLDEAYYEYIDAKEQFDSVTWLDSFPNLIITRTFSKAYGLAGLRVGYGLSSNLIADLLNRVRQPFNNNALALVAAEA
ncbi:MAG: aminotransferase class I/II-fold pyridoxal phosphate-dependent enzyme, partial [Methylococcaceae bacterium]